MSSLTALLSSTFSPHLASLPIEIIVRVRLVLVFLLSFDCSSFLLLFIKLVLEVFDARVLAKPVSEPAYESLAGGVDDAYCVDTHQFKEKDNV